MVTLCNSVILNKAIKFLDRMKFNISLRLFDISLSELIRKNTESIINELSNNLNAYIAKRDYGKGILEYDVIIYVINMPNGYEHLYKDFNPKYIESKLFTNKHTGEVFEINKHFSYSVKIEGEKFEWFLSEIDEGRKKILAQEILNSLSNLDKLPKKVKEFDKERFKEDIEQFFKSEKLIKL